MKKVCLHWGSNSQPPSHASHMLTTEPPGWSDKILDMSKINVTQTLKFALGRVENIVGKGENAGFQHFLLVPQYFQELTFVIKSQDSEVKG